MTSLVSFLLAISFSFSSYPSFSPLPHRILSHPSIANLVLQDTIERLLSPPLYSQTQRGVYIVRGENVVLLAEIDLLTEEETFSRMQLTSEQEVKAILDREAQERLEQSRVRNRVLRERGFSILDPPDTDNY